MSIFDNLIYYVVAIVIDICAAVGWGILAAMFMSNIMDIKKQTDGDANLDSIPATLGTAVLCGIIGFALSIWLFTFKSTGAVLSNMVAFTVFYIIAMWVATIFYRRFKRARPSVNNDKRKGEYPRNW